jgi:LuxR family maltose regulon positive regulatory protein
MDDTSLVQRADRTDRAGRPAFDLVVSKLRRPWMRPGIIHRSSLLEQLARDDQHPVVSVVAPAGYGKTTLLSQWADRSGQAVAWVSLDEGDNDPKVLLAYVAAALDAIEPVGERVFDALASPMSSVPGSVVPRLGSAFSSMTAPVALVLDDVHLLHNLECRAAVSVLADHVPGGSRLVLAGRDEPPLQTARLRAQGRILEIGPGELSLTCEKASSLLGAAELALDEAQVAELHRRTEGWPVGLYLAALAIRAAGSPQSAAVSFGGDDRLVADYVEAEFLARLPGRQREFLTRTAALERMSGPLCAAVLEVSGSAAMLEDLARSNLLVVPLDQQGHWYRYHRLFRDTLLGELERREPELLPVLRRRAAAWCLENGLREEALEYSLAAGDVDGVAGLVEQLGLSTYRHGRITTVRRWLGWLADRDGIQGRPLLLVQAAYLFAVMGRAVEAERWAEALDRWQYGEPTRPEDPAGEAWAVGLRAILCRGGAEQMRADADQAARKLPEVGVALPAAVLVWQGIARILCGDPADGDAHLAAALDVAGGTLAPDVLALALCQRSLVAMAHGHWGQAESLAGLARAVVDRAGLEDVYATPLVCAVQARAAMHRGDVGLARQRLVDAQRLRPLLTYALPHLAVQARIELIRVDLALGDLAGARTLMREVDDLLRRRPGLGTLVGEAEALRARLSKERDASIPGASALSAAELRLLPLLPTHLSFRQIGREFFLSPSTVKTQALSVYRKLGVSSRSQAVTRAQELGLLEQ